MTSSRIEILNYFELLSCAELLLVTLLLYSPGKGERHGGDVPEQQLQRGRGSRKQRLRPPTTVSTTDLATANVTPRIPAIMDDARGANNQDTPSYSRTTSCARHRAQVHPLCHPSSRTLSHVATLVFFFCA